MRRPRHSELYAATADIHAATEKVVEKAGYFASPARYADYLRRMHAFYRRFTLSQAAPSGQAQICAWRIPDRIAWLNADLAALAVPTAAISSTAPRLAASLDLTTPASLLGGLYVLVGSTLGAPILLRLANRLDLSTAGGRLYLTSIARERSWQRFLDCLEAEPAHSLPALVAGSVATFECLLEHLSGAPQ